MRLKSLFLLIEIRFFLMKHSYQINMRSKKGSTTLHLCQLSLNSVVLGPARFPGLPSHCWVVLFCLEAMKTISYGDLCLSPGIIPGYYNGLSSKL